MANSVVLGDDGIILIKVEGDQTEESVNVMGRQVEACLAKLAEQNKPGLVIDDITKLGATNIPARQTVAMYARTLPYKKLAMLGDGNTAMRVGTNLLLKAIGMGSKVKYFEDRAEATKWLLGA